MSRWSPAVNPLVVDFLAVVRDVEEKLGSKSIPLQIPIGAEETFRGVVDLITMQAIVWNEEDQGMTFEVIDMPADLEDTETNESRQV